MVALLYAMFFLSGGAALIYEVGWARSLSLVFGGSHLAVTTVLAIFMGGLALGSSVVGRRADRVRSNLRLYAALEAGIGISALVFLLLSRIYPSLYVPLARLAPENSFYLSALRVAFASAAMIVPTTLMGGTLPVLSRLMSRGELGIGRHLPLLYGLNTLGAVAGAAAAGFLLLPRYGVSTAMLVAVAVNIAIGAAALFLASRWGSTDREHGAGAPGGASGTTVPVAGNSALTGRRVSADAASEAPAAGALGAGAAPVPPRAYTLVLAGIGVSGFCALGYEVLWTRVLSMVIGTSAYSFTIMLVAFLAGIGIGGALAGPLVRRLGAGRAEGRWGIAAFGAIQAGIGILGILVTTLLRDLPGTAMRLQSALAGTQIGEFGTRQGTSFALASLYMLPPAVLMGAALPLAGMIAARRRAEVGRAVGDVLAVNTTGAILGAACSGFLLIYAFGVERSLQILGIVNLGIGAWIALALSARLGRLHWAAPALAAGAGLALALSPGWAHAWDRDFFAIYRNNQREAFDSQEKIRDAVANTEVLYYHEGVNETISVIRPKGGRPGLIVNGRTEASAMSWDIQCQKTLGHLPMLLHPNPRRVFVLGLGTGMTLGATSIHPEVESITLAEIERGVLPAARAFGAYNHDVLDHPKLRIVFDDGRNFLRTTTETFDVITADPIHPWSGGAAYLYTAEYFHSVAAHLRPGGMACQWLPIYELSAEDLKSIVRTFSANFPSTMLWLTHYDAELLGSNAPIVIDEARLEERIAFPAVRADLDPIDMASGSDYLSYAIMGTRGLAAFGAGGVLNTDDNVHLEFAAPASMGVVELMGSNVLSLSAGRENLTPYLRPSPAPPVRTGEAVIRDGPDAAGREEQIARWARLDAAGRVYDRAHSLFLSGNAQAPEFASLLSQVERLDPGYAPARFLRREAEAEIAREPELLLAKSFEVSGAGGARSRFELEAVGMRVGEERGVVMFVDNHAREIYGQRYLQAKESDLPGAMRAFAADTLRAAGSAYAALASGSKPEGGAAPSEVDAKAKIRAAVSVQCAETR